MEEKKFKDSLDEAFKTDYELIKLKKQSWDMQEEIQRINLQKAKITTKYAEINIKIQERKMQLKKEIVNKRSI